MKKSGTTFNDEIEGAHCDTLSLFFFFLIIIIIIIIMARSI